MEEISATILSIVSNRGKHAPWRHIPMRSVPLDGQSCHFLEMTRCLVEGSEINLSISEKVMSWMSRFIC